MFSPLFVCLFICLSVSRISQNGMDGFGWNFVYKFDVWQGRIVPISVKIRIRIRELFNFLSDSSPLRDGTKNDIEDDISKSCARIQMKLGGQVVYVTRANWFNFVSGPDPDPADTKHQLFSLVEVCALPSANQFCSNANQDTEGIIKWPGSVHQGLWYIRCLPYHEDKYMKRKI